tara:strand:- start:204 stop:836 length:633 start_codon:yes stop_codon:yes gene_type:complete
MIKDFIGIFPNAFSKDYCDKIIYRFNYLQRRGQTGRGRVMTRQEHENPTPTVLKEDSSYFMGGIYRDDLPLVKEDVVLMEKELYLLTEFNNLVWKYYDEYVKTNTFLSALSYHQMSSTVRIQKSSPSQGYHLWHCDTCNIATSRRVLAVGLYLNTVEEGGETEFLYQSKRVKPVQGTLVIFPAIWTHPHRGNPPLKGDKYFMTTWIEFVQ